MKELELKYGCNPNQKPSRIFMEGDKELPITVLSGRPLLQSIQQDLQEDLSGKVQKLPSDILKYYDLASGLMIDGVGSDLV